MPAPLPVESGGVNWALDRVVVGRVVVRRHGRRRTGLSGGAAQQDRLGSSAAAAGRRLTGAAVAVPEAPRHHDLERRPRVSGAGTALEPADGRQLETELAATRSSRSAVPSSRMPSFRSTRGGRR